MYLLEIEFISLLFNQFINNVLSIIINRIKVTIIVEIINNNNLIDNENISLEARDVT